MFVVPCTNCNIYSFKKMQSNDLYKRKFSTWLSLLHLLITNIKKHLEVIYTLSSIQIRRVREMTAAVEMCFGMINSPDSRWCLCHSVEPPVAMSHYPHPTNGRRRQIINLPWWWQSIPGLPGTDWAAFQPEDQGL